MPVLLDRGQFKPILLGSPSCASLSDFADHRTIEIALINNMPDSAVEATERQFASLLTASAAQTLVRLKVYALDEVPRSVATRRYIDTIYSPIDSLWAARPPQGLIVTGAEPRAASLVDEPYWNAFVQVLEWAQCDVVSAIWSCLAAHAAVLHMDGIKRRPLRGKRSGIFQCVTVPDHPLTARLARAFDAPHSRYNDLSHRELVGTGYTILSRSERAGVDSFVKKGRGTMLFFQGHPEYESDTLFREYRRDVGRFLKGERASYPAMPERYFPHDLQARLTAFGERALVDRSESLLADFPKADGNLMNTWRTPAIQIYRNWLNGLSADRNSRPNLATRKASQRSAQALASFTIHRD
jgi:homoserine O-succinyltransferase/O-acetyltransferase